MIKGTSGQIFVAKQYGYKDIQNIVPLEQVDEDMEDYED